MPRDAALVLYARAPLAGAVKTRLIPWLDPQEALLLHLALLEDSLRLLRVAAAAADAVPHLSLDGPWPSDVTDAHDSVAEAARGIDRLPQAGATLGDRLLGTFRDLFARGFRQMLVIGSDSPTLPVDSVTGACVALRHGSDVVLVPAEDGGYCLVGAARPLPRMFEGIPWGTSEVFATTRAALETMGARLEILPAWYDIDRPRDLERLRREMAARGSGGVPSKTGAFVERLLRDGRLPLPERDARSRS